MTTLASKYTAAELTALEGLEPVRKRPSMYIGGVDGKGLHHLVWEILDNAVDEYLNGYADGIHVTLHKPGDAVTVQDNGRGIPVDMHPKLKKSGLEVVLTVLHAGGKFGDHDNYFFSGGLHGVGASVVNALSKKLVATIRRDGAEWRQTYKRGKPVTALEEVGPFRGHGTIIYFEPDPEIFKTTHFDPEVIKTRLEDMSYVHSGLKITFKNEITGESLDLAHPGGIPEFLTRLVADAQKPTVTEQPFALARNNGERMEVALQWTEATDETIRSYVNGIRTAAGGTHENGLKKALVKAIRNFIATHEIKTKGLDITADDIREGVVAVLSVFVREPQFQGQTKEKLHNAELEAAVDNWLRPALEAWLNANMSAADQIVGRIVLAAKARLASREAAGEVNRKAAGSRRLNLPGKLADCQNSGLDESELFVVEGDSAGGCFSGDTRVALADGRDLTFEALVKEQAEGKEHYCYTIRQDGQIGLERALNARRTTANAKVVRVHLDNGEAITCTPDHLFMIRDGSYRRADALSAGDSLMPLYRKLSDMNEPGITIQGYEMVWSPRSDCWLFTHMLADWYNRWRGAYTEQDGDHCHHVDFNKRNNNPTNLVRLDREAHLALHREHLAKTLHSPEAVAKSRAAHQTDEYRAWMSERMRREGTRALLSANARQQWEVEQYKQYMLDRWRAFYESNEEYRRRNAEQFFRAQMGYWADEANRHAQAEQVRTFFAEHPERREELSRQATEQWQDEQLRAWRSAKTREQWTPEFRARRRATLEETYLRKTLAALKGFERAPGRVDLEAYQQHRLWTRDRTLLRFDRFCRRYFGGDVARALEAVANQNHRVVKVERLTERIDVYDLEVPHSHNFALASGAFVHNSAKQGRNNKTQAVLPLRGKVLNSEGMGTAKALGNQELSDLVSAIGTGAGDKFDAGGLRYGKIILLMDADADGYHISTLLLAFFFRHMTELIRKGHVYLAQPPLYSIVVGKEKFWARDDAHKEEILAGLRANARYEVQRFKGLGEMNPEQLRDTTLDPRQRTLLKVQIDSNLDADKTFVDLLGKDPAQRYRFVMDKAALVEVEDLDV